MTNVPTRSDPDVISLTWTQFQTWFKAMWEPGQHVALVGPTGTGKTTLVVGFLPLRKYVLALDAKGGDSTLSTLEQHGFVRIGWPPSREIRKQIEEGQPARLIVGDRVRTTRDLPKLRRQIGLALRDAYDEEGWTVYCDELQIIADRRFMGLGASIERNLIAARDRKVSMVMSYQRPANVPPAAAEMSTWFITLYTRDRDVVARLAEMAGRYSGEMRGMIRGLPQYCVLVFSRDPRAPIIVTKADKA